MTILQELFANKILMAGIASWAIAQVLKTIIYAAINRELRMERLTGDGGMPSGHSATVSGLATMAALVYGVGSFEFAIAGILATVVMHDAMGVRLEAGKQAKVIKEIVSVFKDGDAKYIFSEETLKDFVGHTPLQVGAGCALGILIACLMY